MRRQPKKQKSELPADKPMRRCIGCQESFPQDQLMRFTMRDSKIIPDISGRNEGRGIYLCRNQSCIDRAVKRKSFCRACRTQVDMESVTRAIETALNTN